MEHLLRFSPVIFWDLGLYLLKSRRSSGIMSSRRQISFEDFLQHKHSKQHSWTPSPFGYSGQFLHHDRVRTICGTSPPFSLSSPSNSKEKKKDISHHWKASRV